MARQVLPIVGAIIGGMYGGPAGAQWGYAIGSVIGNAVDPLVVKGPKLGEAGLQTSAEGVFRPIVFGTGAVKGNVIARGNRQIKKKREQEGKGGPVTETERVYWTFAIRICEAKDATGGIALLRMWEDEKLVFDATPTSQIVEETNEFAQRFRFYNGSDAQLPDPDLEAYKGVGNVNAHRGTCYIVFPNYDLTDTGERIKDYRFEVASASSDESVLVDSLAISSGGGVLESPNGITWNEASNQGVGGPDRLFAGPDRYVMWSLGQAFYSIDGGANWVASSGDLGNSGGVRTAAYFAAAQQYIIGGNVAGVSVSSDNSATYTTYPGRAIGAIAVSAAIVMAVDNNMLGGGLVYTMDATGPWTEGDVISGDLAAECGSHSETGFKFGGSGGGDPIIISVTNVGTYEVDDTPAFVTATTVRAILHANGIWVAGTDSGERLYFDPQDGWLFADDEFPGDVRQISFNGELFLMAGGDYIQSSPDGKTWTTRYTEAGISAIASLYYERQDIAGEKVSLSSIVAELCDRPGLPANRYDVTELTDMVDGLVLADDYTYADAIRVAMPIYFFGSTEHDAGSGYKLHFPKHGKAVVTTLTIDDFVDVPDKSVRQDAFERPRVLHVHYQSPTVGYAPAKASPMRFSPDVKVVGESSVQVPFAFKDQDEIWQRADKMLKIIWTGIAGEEEFSLPMSFLYMVPTDAVGISLRGQVRRMVFSNQSYAAGVINSKLVSDRQGNYTSTLTGIPLPPPTPPPPSIVGPTIMAFGDWPALNDNNDRLLYYLGVTGQTEAWHGAQVDRSTDGGANFVEAATFRQNTVMGVLQEDITAASRYFTDTTNVIYIHLYLDDEIESLSEAQFNSEGGAFMLSYQESGGTRWEMIQYRDAEQDSNGDWVLTKLKRGQLNTEPAAHGTGDVFVLLDGVQSVDAVTAWINTDLTHRATSIGRSSDGVPTQTDEYTGQSQREFPIANLILSKPSSTINGTIIPRHRFGTESVPIRSINWSGYKVTFQATGQFDSLLTTSDNFTFDASGWASPITVTVTQQNRLTGDGEPFSESIA